MNNNPNGATNVKRRRSRLGAIAAVVFGSFFVGGIWFLGAYLWGGFEVGRSPFGNLMIAGFALFGFIIVPTILVVKSGVMDRD